MRQQVGVAMGPSTQLHGLLGHAGHVAPGTQVDATQPQAACPLLCQAQMVQACRVGQL